MKPIFYSLIVFIFSFSVSNAAIIFVNDENTLQTTINNAVDGDVIKVNVNITKNIEIRNKTNVKLEAYQGSVWLGAGLSDNLLRIYQCSNITIEGFNFTLQRVNEVGIKITHYGQTTNTTIRNCSIYCRYATNTYGIIDLGHNTVIDNCNIIGEAFSVGILAGDYSGWINHPLYIDSYIYAQLGVQYNYSEENSLSFEDSDIYGTSSCAIFAAWLLQRDVLNLKNNAIHKSTSGYTIYNRYGGYIYVTKKPEVDNDLTGGSGFTETFPYGRNDRNDLSLGFILDLN